MQQQPQSSIRDQIRTDDIRFDEYQQLIDRLDAIELDLLIRTYDTQRTIFLKMKSITRVMKNLDWNDMMLGQQGHLRSIYEHWRMFYLTHYYSELFDRKKSSEFDKSFQQFCGGSLSKVQFGSVQSNTLYSAFDIDRGSWTGKYKDNNLDTEKDGKPTETKLNTVNPNSKYSLLSNESSFFTVFGENRPSILLFLELYQFWNMMRGVSVSQEDKKKRSDEITKVGIQTYWNTKLIKFLGVPNFMAQYFQGSFDETGKPIGETLDIYGVVDGIGDQFMKSTGVEFLLRWHAFLEDISRDLMSMTRAPPHYILFALSHLYYHIELMRTMILPTIYDNDVHQNHCVPKEIQYDCFFKNRATKCPRRIKLTPEAIELKEFDIHKVIHYYTVNDMTMTPSISVEIEDYVFYFISSTLGIRAIYILNEVSMDKKERYRNIPVVRTSMDDSHMHSINKFIPDLYNELRGEDAVILQRQWSLLITQKDFRLHNIGYLIFFHFYLQDNIQFPWWHQRYVVNLEQYARYGDYIDKYSRKIPMFVEVQPLVFHMLFRDEFYYSPDEPELLLYTYLQIVKNVCEGTFPSERNIVGSVPWTFVTQRDFPYLIRSMDDVWKSDVYIEKLFRKSIPECWEKILKYERSRAEGNEDVTVDDTEVIKYLEAYDILGMEDCVQSDFIREDEYREI